MSDDESKEIQKEDMPVGRLIDKTTTYEVTMQIQDTSVLRSTYLTIYGEKDKEGKRPYYVLSITNMWSDETGMRATLIVLGDRPKRPFNVAAEVYKAKEVQITKLLGIYNPPEESVSLGKLLGYPFDVNLLVKNFGRIFITGKSGSGKSYTMGVLCEEFMKKGIPVVILDRHGEYGSLKVAAKEGEEKINGGQSEFVEKIIEFSDLKINKGGDIDVEYLFSLDATDLVAPNLCTIVNMRGMDLTVQEMIAGKLLKKLYQASTSRRIVPFYLFLDEAHLFAGKKRTETCETVKLFSQEGRKFGANLVIGTQRPQLLDTTIRAQAGSWVVHNLTDVRDIDVTISSAEDLSKDNKKDISGLDKGEAIICGEAVKGIPLYVKIRKRRTEHGGIGFNPLDFLPKQTVEELQVRRQRILGDKSANELETGKAIFEEITSPKTSAEYMDEIALLKVQIKELEEEVEMLKDRIVDLESGEEGEMPLTTENIDERIEELQTQLKVWQEKYNYLKESMDNPESFPQAGDESSERIIDQQNSIIELEADLEKYKSKYTDAIILAEKAINELKKRTK
ncbi:MAG: helicase HerA domain-containing protein [Candidatus Heimdallarchaeota archaeon]